MHRKNFHLLLTSLVVSACWFTGAIAEEPASDALEEARRTCFEMTPGSQARAVVAACDKVIEAREADQARQAEAYYRRGAARQRVGQLYQARSDWNQALRLDRKHVQAHLQLARWSLLSNNLEFALEYYREVARLEPGNPQAHHGIGMALRRMARFDEAFEALGKAVELEPTLWRSRVEMAKIHEHRGEIQAALDAYARAISVVRRSEDWHFVSFWPAPEPERARLLHRLGRTREAIVDLTAAIKRHPHNFAIKQLRAEYHVERLEYEPAIADYTALVEAMPDRMKAEPLFARARLYQKIGDADAAYEDMQEVVRVGGVEATLRLQVYLKNKGYEEVEIDGKFSDAMRNALKTCVATPACARGIKAPI